MSRTHSAALRTPWLDAASRRTRGPGPRAGRSPHDRDRPRSAPV